MNTTEPILKCLLLFSLIAALLPVPEFARFNPAAPGASPQLTEGWTARLRLRDWQLEDPRETPGASASWFHHLGRI